MRKIVIPDIPKFDPIKFKKKIKVPRKKALGEVLSEQLKDPSIRPKVTITYEYAFRIIEVIREIKYSGLDLNMSADYVQNKKMIALDVLPDLLEPIIHEPVIIQTLLAKDFLAFARKKCKSRLKVLESLMKDINLATDLGVEASTLKVCVSDVKALSVYFHRIRAGKRKFAKLFCIFPILTILRLNDEGPAKRERYMRELLLKLEAPDFAYSHIGSKDKIGEPEELARIREWDRESIEWFQSL